MPSCPRSLAGQCPRARSLTIWRGQVRGPENADMSELEWEFELETASDQGGINGGGGNAEFEFLVEDNELDELEIADEELGTDDEFGDRLYELAQREYESEAEVDREVNQVLDEMEREYFWGSLKKLGKSRLLRRLARKGFDLAKSRIPALQALRGITQLARGNLKGSLGQLMKAGLGTAFPGAAPFLPAALSAFGFEVGEDPAENRGAWHSIANVAREAYEYLAENLDEEIDDPIVAGELANRAVRVAMQRVRAPGRLRQRPVRSGATYRGQHDARVIRVRAPRAGDTVVIRFV